MSFGVNNFSNNKPVIQSAQQSQDGGAGNLGYFEHGEKENSKSKDPESIFLDDETDTFSRSGVDEDINEDDFSISKLIAQFIMLVKDWFKKIFG